jgi:hypothetical protein
MKAAHARIIHAFNEGIQPLQDNPLQALRGRKRGRRRRAMKTMGFSRLPSFLPKETGPVSAHGHGRARSGRAVGRTPSTTRLGSRPERNGLSVGATRRRGRWRKAFSLPFQEFARPSWDTRRRDRHRLRQRTDRPHWRGALPLQLGGFHPSSDDFPSLHLAASHVQVFTWELFRAPPGRYPPHAEPGGPMPTLHGWRPSLADRMEASGFFRWRERGPARNS